HVGPGRRARHRRHHPRRGPRIRPALALHGLHRCGFADADSGDLRHNRAGSGAGSRRHAVRHNRLAGFGQTLRDETEELHRTQRTHRTHERGSLMVRAWMTIGMLTSAALLGGCGAHSYITPGRGAQMSLFCGPPTVKDTLTDPGVREVLIKQPLASFPAGLAVARVQEPGYRN